MKVLFIENRYKTFLYEAIAIELEKEGHDVFWLIQNKDYQPKSDRKYIIPYPKKTTKKYDKIKEVEEVILIDRQQNFFKKENKSYFYQYYFKIKEKLNELKPDIVFGESTAFHELLTINLCKKNETLYLNPSSCRYPIGRFSFYKYDTLEPYLGSLEVMQQNKANEIINQIMFRTTTPDYMKKIKQQNGFKDKLTKIKSYIAGERYNTPNPIVKYFVEKEKEKTIQEWDAKIKQKIKKKAAFKILYPLQMQPEANIDVWGKKYRNQSKLIEDLLEHLPKNTDLYVKPNPKSKYELSNELISIVERNKNIISLHHSSKMDDVLPEMDLVVTVTGTIAIECILINKPVITLVKTINNQSKNCVFIPDIKKITNIVEVIKSNSFYKNTLEEKVNFINLLNKTSYKGIVTDPFTDPNCLNKDNIKNMIIAFNSILINE